MVRLYKYLMFFGLLVSSQILLGQHMVQHGLDKSLKGVLYKTEWSLEMSLHHNGYYIGYNRAKIYSFRKTNFYHIDIGYIKDIRSIRQNKNFGELGLSKSFVYGRQNMFFPLRIAKGTKHYLSEKYDRKGIALAYSYRFGPTIGILKPVYLDFFSYIDGTLNTNLDSKRYDKDSHDEYMNYDRIYGGSGILKGWDELRLIPGIHANTAFHFALGAYGKYVRVMELGVMMDLYIKKIPLMVETKLIHNKPYFIKLYVNLQIGVRNN